MTARTEDFAEGPQMSEPLLVDRSRNKTARAVRDSRGASSFNDSRVTSLASTRSSDRSSVGDYNVGTSGETMERPNYRKALLSSMQSMSSQTS